MREITPLLQIRQVAQRTEHYMQPARAPRAKEHTNNPVQRPHFRGHAAGDVEVTRACGAGKGTPTDDLPLGLRKSTREDSGREDPGGRGGASSSTSAVVLLRLRRFQLSPLSPWQIPGQARAGTQRYVGLAARACTETSMHAAQTQARTQHKPP